MFYWHKKGQTDGLKRTENLEIDIPPHAHVYT